MRKVSSRKQNVRTKKKSSRKSAKRNSAQKRKSIKMRRKSRIKTLRFGMPSEAGEKPKDDFNPSSSEASKVPEAEISIYITKLDGSVTVEQVRSSMSIDTLYQIVSEKMSIFPFNLRLYKEGELLQNKDTITIQNSHISHNDILNAIYVTEKGFELWKFAKNENNDITQLHLTSWGVTMLCTERFRIIDTLEGIFAVDINTQEYNKTRLLMTRKDIEHQHIVCTVSTDQKKVCVEKKSKNFQLYDVTALSVVDWKLIKTIDVDKAQISFLSGNFNRILLGKLNQFSLYEILETDVETAATIHSGLTCIHEFEDVTMTVSFFPILSCDGNVVIYFVDTEETQSDFYSNYKKSILFVKPRKKWNAHVYHVPSNRSFKLPDNFTVNCILNDEHNILLKNEKNGNNVLINIEKLSTDATFSHTENTTVISLPETSDLRWQFKTQTVDGEYIIYASYSRSSPSVLLAFNTKTLEWFKIDEIVQSPTSNDTFFVSANNRSIVSRNRVFTVRDPEQTLENV